MSTKRSKRYQEAAKLVIPNKNYSITEAVETMKSFPAPKFDPTVTVSFHLTVDPRKSDQMVRGSVSLPNGTGKNVRVLVFAQGDAAKAAQEAGAEFVGFEDLIKKVQGGFVDFDTAIATPDAMTEVRKVARVLGPRGLMPNPKTGTVTDDTAKAVNAAAGRIRSCVDIKLMHQRSLVHAQQFGISADVATGKCMTRQFVERARLKITQGADREIELQGNFGQCPSIVLPGLTQGLAGIDSCHCWNFGLRRFHHCSDRYC